MARGGDFLYPAAMREADERGFTLLEVLAAMAVMAVLLVMLTQGVRFGAVASSGHARSLRAIGDLDTADHTIRALIESMSPGTPAGIPPDFIGEEGRLAFTGALPAEATGSASREADIILSLSREHGLLISWTPHPRLLTDRRPASSVLAEGVNAVQFAYWGSDEAATTGWRREWRGTALPELIRVRVSFSQASGQHWPDIVVAPRRERPRP